MMMTEIKKEIKIDKFSKNDDNHQKNFGKMVKWSWIKKAKKQSRKIQSNQMMMMILNCLKIQLNSTKFYHWTTLKCSIIIIIIWEINEKDIPSSMKNRIYWSNFKKKKSLIM